MYAALCNPLAICNQNTLRADKIFPVKRNFLCIRQGKAPTLQFAAKKQLNLNFCHKTAENKRGKGEKEENTSEN